MRAKIVLLLMSTWWVACDMAVGIQEYDVKIKNATIVDVINGDLIKDKIVLVSPDGIITLAKAGTFANALHEIDASGKFLMPALWDMHVHFRGGEELIEENKKLLPMYIAHGVTTVRDAGGDLTKSIFKWRSAIDKKELTGPYIFTSGPKIDGPNARWAGSLEVNDEKQVDKALDSLESLKVDFVKLYDSRLSKEMYLYLLEQCRERGLKVSGHMPFTVMLQDAIDRNVTSVEHLYYVLKGCSSREFEITEKIRSGELGFWGSMAQLIESYDDSIATVRMKNMREANVFVVPTLHIGNILSYLDVNNHESDEYLKFIGPGIRETYQGRIQGANSADSAAIENRHNLHQTFRRLAAKLESEGVKLLAGSDGGAFNSYVYPGLSIHKELEIMVESGMKPLDALQTATINGPSFFGKDMLDATISTGSTSDLLLLDANPLEEITNTTKISGLVLDGSYLEKSELEELLKSIENK